jgi:collagenase-like PrtC family protease
MKQQKRRFKMAQETRVYRVNIDDIEVDTNDLTNEQFIAEAEKQGNVYSLTGFVDAFNDDEGISII